MIKSMTGFGRAEVITKERKITVELKSVNHRYLDLSIKMPRKLVFLEGAIRNLMKTYMQRGKVDVFITYEDYTLSCGALKYNKELAGEYLAYIRQMAEEFGLENDVKAGALSRYPDVLTMRVHHRCLHRRRRGPGNPYLQEPLSLQRPEDEVLPSPDAGT